MNYFVTAALLKAASFNSTTRDLYRALTKLKGGSRLVFSTRAAWVQERLPERPVRVLELGTGWAHVYSVFLALLRDDEISTFDVADIRQFQSFGPTVRTIMEQIRELDLDPELTERAAKRAQAMIDAPSFEAAYAAVNMRYQHRSSGIPDYPDDYFDALFSIDVLEHVGADSFHAAAESWYRITKPGGLYMAQVGLDDHLAFYQNDLGSKRYLQYSENMWKSLLGNEVQYINRLTASQIRAHLEQVGFVVDEFETLSCKMTMDDVHPDYRNQTLEDVRATRLYLVAHKPA